MQKLKKPLLKIGNSALPSHFEAQGEVIVFDGFLKVYGISKTEEDDEGKQRKAIAKSKCRRSFKL